MQVQKLFLHTHTQSCCRWTDWHVARQHGLAAASGGRSDGDDPLTATTRLASVDHDDSMLSHAVCQFYTGKQQDSSGAVKVFSHTNNYCLLPWPNNVLAVIVSHSELAACHFCLNFSECCEGFSAFCVCETVN